MKKTFLFLLSLSNFYIFAPPKGFKGATPKTEVLQWVPSAPETSGNRILLGDISTAAAPARAFPEAQPASASFLRDGAASEIHNDESFLAGFGIADDLSDVHPVPAQRPETWMAVLYEKYNKTFNEQCLFQRFCQLLGAKKKYTVLNELLSKGQLISYIDELNDKNISTGDSLLNEALCQAILDNQRDIVIRLLSETLKYKDRLSTETKQRIDIFLQQDNTDNQLNISKKVGEYLERIRLTTQIRHVLAGTPYDGPNLLAMTAAAYAQVKLLTDGVATNSLVIPEDASKPK